ncbi:MAG: glutamine-hydrolyzing carbamoyl-phosphate synthase small subunit [Methanomassiliicoccaceae archaeon]|jgi:carbamoyl-phosphate synthase small subunit|nr:glutamine-hydrolyzing carbamoyl-phosphate synthase small subunit [Methanomassiliicoccaceae archaeon]
MMRCFLVIGDGTVFEGMSFGHQCAVLGEIVFTTSMSGYQESITDPAYKGQILVSAYPLIGDYGINEKYAMSDGIHTAGLVVREYCHEPSDMYGGRTLDSYMKEHMIPGISGIYTRDVIKIIRDNGTMNAAIVYDEKDIDAVKKKLKKKIEPRCLVPSVSVKKAEKIDNGKGISIGIVDCGTVRSMISDLSEKYDIMMFPYDTKASEITDSGVKGLIISSGPGDPGDPVITATVVRTVKDLSSKMPIAGVAFGAQAIAAAFGCKMMKMKFGHHGSSQPVRSGKRAYITSQNHLYTIDPDSVKGTDIIVDQTNVNDLTVEGFSHRTLPIFGIMYYPPSLRFGEGSYFYEKFDKMMEARR